MAKPLTKIKLKIVRIIYKAILRPIFFRFDPENIHNIAIKFLRNPIFYTSTKLVLKRKTPKLKKKILGLTFENPIGLAAGFDKNADLHNIDCLGFGFTEVGSVTADPCDGNPKPRLWRMKKHKSLQVNYGLANQGAEAISKKLKNKKFNIPLGISIAKTNCKANASKKEAIADYAKSFELLHPLADYITINISCPNTYGGEPFTNPKDLDDLLKEIRKIKCKKPILIKLPVDLTEAELTPLIEVAENHKIDGYVCTNLTKDRNISTPGHSGGVSGQLLKDKSTETIRLVHKLTKGESVIIGVGGINSPKDAIEKLKAGATLLQLITGMIYEGPQLIAEINLGLEKEFDILVDNA